MATTKIIKELEKLEKESEMPETEQKPLNLFKLQYSWFEGEFQSCIFATKKDKSEVEKDLKEAVSSVKIDWEDEKDVDCLPTAYERVIETLENKGYSPCYFIEDPVYITMEWKKKRDKKFRVYTIENEEKRRKLRKI